VQHEGVSVGAQVGADEEHALGHKPGHEVHVTGKAVELGNDDRRVFVVVVLDAPGRLERLAQFRPPGEGIALGALDLDETRHDVEPLTQAELPDGLALRFEPEPGAALLLRAHPHVLDAWLALAVVIDRVSPFLVRMDAAELLLPLDQETADFGLVHLAQRQPHRGAGEPVAACGGLDVPRRVAGAASDLPGCVFTAKGPDFLASGPSRSIQAFPPLSVISMISSSRPLHISRYLIKVRRRVTCRIS